MDYLLKKYLKKIASKSKKESGAKIVSFKRSKNDISPRKKLSVLVLSKCIPVIGRSYIKLPDHLVTSKASGQTPLGMEVLNDEYVCLPRGTCSNRTPKISLLQEYEFVLEDRRYQMDISIEAYKNSILLLQRIQTNLKKRKTYYGTCFKFQKALPARAFAAFRQAINTIYGKSGQEIFEKLEQFPSGVIPVVLKRFHQMWMSWCFKKVMFEKEVKLNYEKLASLQESK